MYRLKETVLALCLLPILGVSQQSPLSYQAWKLLNNENYSQSRSSNNQLHAIVKGHSTSIQSFLDTHEGTIKYQYEDLFSIRIPLSELEELASVKGIEKIELHQSPITVQDATALNQTKSNIAHSGGGSLQQAYTGKDVVVGVIDSGIDPTHPDFKNDDGTTRILAFWDQNDFSGSLAPYGYGTEYTNVDIDAGAMNNYLDTTYDGHGTPVTGVAAGGGKVRSDVKGMAPEADIVVVGIRPSTLDYTNRLPHTLQIVDGINYIFKQAEAVGKPAVINISLGGIEGSHDGEDLPTQMIEKMLDEKAGRVLVTSAGNAGTVMHHVRYDLNSDTAFTWFRSMYSNSALCQRDSGAYMSFYGDEADFKNLRINVAAENRSPCCSADAETGFRNMFQTIGRPVIDTFKNGNAVIGVVTMYLEKIGNSYGFFVDIDSEEMNRFWRMQFTGKGTVDGWSGPLSRRTCNSDFIYRAAAAGTPAQTRKLGRYVEPDTDQNIGTAYASSEKVVTVGAYTVRSEMRDVDSVLQTFPNKPLERASFSSRGPNRVGVIKPDITGPGERIITAQPSQILTEKAQSGRSTLYLGGQHSVTDGTSFSAPAVAGIIALYLEKNPEATYSEVLQALHATADQDSLTGQKMPNNENGYGRVNAYQLLLYEAPVGQIENESPRFLVYPNPSSGQITIETSKFAPAKRVSIYNMQGQLIQTIHATDYQYNLAIEKQGMYVVEVQFENGNIIRQSLIKQ